MAPRFGTLCFDSMMKASSSKVPFNVIPSTCKVRLEISLCLRPSLSGCCRMKISLGTGQVGVRSMLILNGRPNFLLWHSYSASTLFPIPSFELFLPVRPQGRACHKSIQIKIQPQTQLHETKSYPQNMHQIQSNPMRSKSTQISSNLNPQKIKKHQHQTSKNSLKIKITNTNQRKSIKIKSKPTHPNPTQSTSKPNHQNRHQHQNKHQKQAMESKPLLVQFLLVVNVCIQSLQNVLGQ